MQTNLTAIEPNDSATVSASAGTGKTWLLVSRIIRLLLAGAEPASILAITFTRKAAAEMRQRLSARLQVLATCHEAELHAALQEINAPTDKHSIEQARRLYERLLHQHYRINITTFHAFCQDVLRRFPLEADVPPGFELIESTADLEQAAWDLIFNETTQAPESEIAVQLDLLFEHCGSIFSTKAALDSFLNHRSDWWAYVDGQEHPENYALNKLQRFLDYDPNSSPLEDFFNIHTLQDLADFQTLLAKHPTSTNENSQMALDSALTLQAQNELQRAMEFVEAVFFTKEGNPRTRKESQVQKKKMGLDGEARFLAIHENMIHKLSIANQGLLKIANFNLNKAWYLIGSRLLTVYQTLKKEQRLLDFSDLEWKAYQLLNHSDHAHWVQYKLDMRINHLLIDEFQDTNPTQWHLISPLLKELAAEGQHAGRSVFIVGDTKQSIYRFRRADPQLFHAATEWLAAHADARNMPLSKSWRSSPAIIDCVNKIFQHNALVDRIQTFSTHTTHHTELWGHVEILPLVAKPEGEIEEETGEAQANHLSAFRNPLHQPRQLLEDTRHYEEGSLIAKQINQLIEQQTQVGSGESTTALQYSDIIILLKQRTHSSAYEQALRDANIPYAGAERGTLLHCLEIRDIVALLELLVTPFNDLSLANVLRSPIFGFSNAQLIALARFTRGTWIDRLKTLAESQSDTVYHYAYSMLRHWHALSGSIPVHDLLDHIYSQAGIMQRYRAATPAHLQSRVQSNLLQFLELALEVDSGRYPSIGRFLLRLQLMKSRAQSAPDEKSYSRDTNFVRIMTIHAAKGLEAPVIFLADSANTGMQGHSYQTIVNWPAQSNRPELMILAGKKSTQDANLQQLIESNSQAAQREDANLLYVALTRARQCLYISGCQSKNFRGENWYTYIRSSLAENTPETESIIYEFGKPTTGIGAVKQIETPQKLQHVDSALSQPLQIPLSPLSTSPSQTLSQQAKSDALESSATKTAASPLRGSLIHRMLQLLCESVSETDTTRQLAYEFHIEADDPLLVDCMNESRAVMTNYKHRHLYNADLYQQAFNEVPIHYKINNETRHGVIDRLVITDSLIYLIDYKTHIDVPEDHVAYAQQFSAQLAWYTQGIHKLWPNHPVQTAVLLTHINTLVTLSKG